MAEVPVPAPTPEANPTPTATPTPATPGTPDRFERRYQENIAGMSPPGLEKAGPGSFDQDKFVQQMGEAEQTYQQLVETPTPTATPTPTPTPSPVVEATYPDRARAAGLYEKPTGDADAIKRWMGEVNEKYYAPLTPEQRQEMAVAAREYIKNFLGVKDTADLNPQARTTFQAMWEWFTGKLKR